MFDEDYAFMKDAVVGDLYKIKGPAVKGYVWLPMRQEELARNTKGPRLEVSDSELAEGTGVTKTTVQDYRQKLGKFRIIEVTKRKGSKSKEIAITRVIYKMGGVNLALWTDIRGHIGQFPFTNIHISNIGYPSTGMGVPLSSKFVRGRYLCSYRPCRSVIASPVSHLIPRLARQSPARREARWSRETSHAWRDFASRTDERLLIHRER